MSLDNPCLTCGACCAAFRVAFYWAEADDAPGGIVPVDLTNSLPPSKRCMKGTDTYEPRCIALDGPVGDCVSCRIYEQRPSPCREVTAGSDQCNRARTRYGLPLLAPCQPTANDDGDDDRTPPCAA